MARATIYHNPRCSKSRQTLTLLQERDLDLEVIEYLQSPPTAGTVGILCEQLGIDPLALMRTKEEKFTELGLSKEDTRPRDEWLRIMSENPILIERPIVVHVGKAALGRPPENVLEIL